MFACTHDAKRAYTDNVVDSLLTYFDAAKNLTINQPAINAPIQGNNLHVLKTTADSIIRQLSKKSTLSYSIALDTFEGDKTRNIHYRYFNSDSLVRAIRVFFALPSPHRHFEFVLTSYEYTTSEIAFNMLNQVATIALTQEFGLNKEPAYVFRVNNFLYWLNVPNCLHESFDALKSSLNQTLKTHSIDSMTNHYQIIEKKGMIDERLEGKWFLKFVCPIHHSDTNLKGEYDQYPIKFTKNSLTFNGSTLVIENPYCHVLPDVQAYFSYTTQFMEGYGLSVNPRLNQYQGTFIRYMWFINTTTLIIPFNSSTIDHFIKLPNAEFGFIANGNFYLLQRKLQTP